MATRNFRWIGAGDLILNERTVHQNGLTGPVDDAQGAIVTALSKNQLMEEKPYPVVSPNSAASCIVGPNEPAPSPDFPTVWFHTDEEGQNLIKLALIPKA